jgi:hypothetical protein
LRRLISFERRRIETRESWPRPGRRGPTGDLKSGKTLIAGQILVILRLF